MGMTFKSDQDAMNKISFLVDNNEAGVRQILTHYDYNVNGMSALALKQLIWWEWKSHGRDISVLFKLPYNSTAKNYTGNINPQRGLVN